jgi:hypothetical protein
VALHALALGSSDPADPNFEKKNKGEYDCHYLHIHFRQKCSDIIANTNILISTEILGLCRHCFRHQRQRHQNKKENDNPKDPEGSEGSTVKDSRSNNKIHHAP